MHFTQLQQAAKGRFLQLRGDPEISTLATDSRKIHDSAGVLFFAWKGPLHDGHFYLEELYNQGVRLFVVEQSPRLEKFPLASFFQVSNAIDALQEIASYHREHFKIPVIGITGSNGKTIVKEWLYQLLSPDFSIVKSPGSYNSQTGVPLSVWNMGGHHQIGVFEAGISRVGEMIRLERVVRPTLGIFTNVGTAHDEGFSDQEEKACEKALLFKNSAAVIYCRDHTQVHRALISCPAEKVDWGFHDDASVPVRRRGEELVVSYRGIETILPIGQLTASEIENRLHCAVAMLYLGMSSAIVHERIAQIRPVHMRLEIKEGIHQSLIIDDSYNADLAGIRTSLEFLKSQRNARKVAIVSDVLQSGTSPDVWGKQLKNLVTGSHVTLLVGIGEQLCGLSLDWQVETLLYHDVEEFLASFDFSRIAESSVLVKGARPFRFERIVTALQRKSHGTTLEVDLNAVQKNLRYFRSLLSPRTKIMAMVKALAYGSGANDVASLLQYNLVDYLGVAYADEGVELRQNGIRVPIMVMNPSEDSFGQMGQYDLEPEVYSLSLLERLCESRVNVPGIHIKLDTGMHRLGLDPSELSRVITTLKKHPTVKVLSVFTHLAAADDPAHDEFTRSQHLSFKAMAGKFSAALGYQPMMHILNTAGILRFPEMQEDMVRLGIGLYGVDPTSTTNPGLTPSTTLKSVVSQVRTVPAGETVGYGRAGKLDKPTRIATFAAGYADGYSRRFGNGTGQVLIRGKLAPVVGRVCMDMTMVDVTDIPVREGDDVILFGPGLPLSDVAASIGTIPYEVLTQTGSRVKRVFYAEGL
ncbi:MAG: bifunctional UDP-N-acetylmuramoyl-tripeptide:D-alanyl-D-alanine ligase/alanine racemase [Cyclobacteriaceae bacterium]